MNRYSYSGADAQVFAYYDGLENRVLKLESVQTVSSSVHEAKPQARSLGFRGARGLGRGSRTIAGSLIAMVIEDNPLRPLLEMAQYAMNVNGNDWGGWSIDRHVTGVGTAVNNISFSNRLATLIPPFNILIMYVSEANSGFFNDSSEIRYAAELIRGVEFMDEGQVVSTHDIVTEKTYSFIALDYKPLSLTLDNEGNLVPMIGIDEKVEQARARRLSQENEAAYPRLPVTGDADNRLSQALKSTYEQINQTGNYSDTEKTSPLGEPLREFSWADSLIYGYPPSAEEESYPAAPALPPPGSPFWR